MNDAQGTEPLDLDQLASELGLDKESIEEEKFRLLKQQRLFALRELRRLADKTQTEISKIMGVTQNRISKLERYELEKLELRTISAFAKALGGNLKIVVTIKGQEVELAIEN
jgi:predicted XRE-type DNA-binding protein